MNTSGKTQFGDRRCFNEREKLLIVYNIFFFVTSFVQINLWTLTFCGMPKMLHQFFVATVHASLVNQPESFGEKLVLLSQPKRP